MTEHIFHRLVQGWDGIEQRAVSHLHHHPATITTSPPQPQETPDMNLASTLEAALADAQKLEGNPGVDALLAAEHVPVGVIVGIINLLAGAFPKNAQPAAEQAAQPAPAGPVVGGQA